MSDESKEKILPFANVDIEKVLTEEIGQTKQKGRKVPLAELSALGGVFSSFSESFRTITTSIEYDGEPLYRKVFPEGISGTVLKYKNEDALTGMIYNKRDGLVGNVRWKEATDLSETRTTEMPYDPTILFMGMALISIDKKLDKIQEIQKEIIGFLKLDKESKIIGSVNSLYETLSQYKFNWDNDTFISAKMNLVQSIKNEAKQNEVFYRKMVEECKDKAKTIHTTINAKNLAKTIRKDLQYLKLSIYMYSCAAFIETMLLGNFSKEYTASVVETIRGYDIRYRELFSECSILIEEQMTGAVDAIVTKGISKANLKVGKAIEKVPVIKKGPIDELMIGLGEKLEDASKRSVDQEIRGFFANRSCDSVQFAEQLEMLSEVYDKQYELYFDKDNLYLVCK